MKNLNLIFLNIVFLCKEILKYNFYYVKVEAFEQLIINFLYNKLLNISNFLCSVKLLLKLNLRFV